MERLEDNGREESEVEEEDGMQEGMAVLEVMLGGQRCCLSIQSKERKFTRPNSTLLYGNEKAEK